jgi:hypothetical protein
MLTLLCARAFHCLDTCTQHYRGCSVLQGQEFGDEVFPSVLTLRNCCPVPLYAAIAPQLGLGSCIVILYGISPRRLAAAVVVLLSSSAELRIPISRSAHPRQSPQLVSLCSVRKSAKRCCIRPTAAYSLKVQGSAPRPFADC